MKYFDVTALCDKGKVRANNEDMVLVKDEFVRDGFYRVKLENDGLPFLVAVSDGMGGHNGGEVASEFVLRQMASAVESLDIQSLPRSVETGFAADDLKKMLESTIRRIHNAVNELGEKNPPLRGLGCTFTALLFLEQRTFYVHIGDSRLYRLRGPFLAQLSTDHTLRNQLNNPSIPVNHLTNCFGGGAQSIFFDFEELSSRIVEGDKLLLCSDGLSGELSDQQIAEILRSEDPQRELVRQANLHGGRDNISCVLTETRIPE